MSLDLAPRGTYVTMSSGGFVYHRREETSLRTLPEPLTPSSVEWLLQDSQARLTRHNWFAVYVILALVVSFGAASEQATTALLIVFAALLVPVYRWNRGRRAVRIFYDVADPEIQARLELASQAARHLAACHRLWHVFYSTPTSDWKRNAGASTLIRRTMTRCEQGVLAHFETNLPAWCVPAGPQRLFFLPEHLLVWDGQHLAALPYDQLTAQADTTRFIESSPRDLPRDGRVVDSTWRFVRRDGGADRRFNNNEKLPVMEYGELDLRSRHGLRVALQTSTPASAHLAARALAELAHRPTAQRPTPAAPMARQAPPLPSPIPALAPAPVPTPPPLPASALTQKPTPAPPARCVALLLRYLASADRRIDDHEIAFATQQLQHLTPGAPDLAELSSTFRALSSEPSVVRAAAQTLASCPLAYRNELMTALDRIAQIDGKTTPKEVERLNEVRRWLYPR